MRNEQISLNKKQKPSCNIVQPSQKLRDFAAKKLMTLTAGLPALGMAGSFVQLKTSNQKPIKNPHLVNKRDRDFSNL
jgi:hypothetical protein